MTDDHILGNEWIMKFDERAPFCQMIRPKDMYMRWQMDIKETKTVKAGQSKNAILVYEILASSTHTFVQHHHLFFILQGSINACHSC